MDHEQRPAQQEVAAENRADEQRVSKKRLIDSLNRSNFSEDVIIVNLEHTRYGTPLFLRAYPQPCGGDVLHCTWAEPYPPNLATSYRVCNFMVDRGLDLLIVDAQSTQISETGITFALPEDCRGLPMRRAKRYAAEGVQVTLMQDAVTCQGTLDDFTADSFRVVVSVQPPQTFESINENAPLYVVFRNGQDMLFTGQCKIIRQAESKRDRVMVIEPCNAEEARPREDRLNSEGHMLVPRPIANFVHPLAKKNVSLEVEETSACWFSVTEYYESAVLFPGLVLPHVELEVAPGFSLNCRAQVRYGEVHEGDGGKTARWWIVVLDMGIQDQGRLFALLQRAANRGAHANGKVDLDDLLRFFFDAGFVYPKKYINLHMYKERFRETYKKLYHDNPAVARHFIQLDRGIIQGHLSMIRFYENSWILHHHAAVGQNGAGLKVLSQARDYVNDYRSLYSSHMDYLMCYFRPDNRFPSRVFGGFARALSNRKQCSMDALAYLNFNFEGHRREDEETAWALDPARPQDLAELTNFYDHVSGGLAMKALDLGPEMADRGTVDEEFEKIGLKREKHLFALSKNGVLKAVILAMVSDVGLNLSNLTNCIHVFIIDGEDMPAEALYRRLASLSCHYSEEEIPVLLYPLSYVEGQSIPYEKIYNLWALDTRYAERFYGYMDGITGGKKGAESNGRQVKSVVRSLRRSGTMPPA